MFWPPIAHVSHAAPSTAPPTFKDLRWRILAKSLIAPVLVLAFFIIAPHWYNSRARAGVLADIEARAEAADKPRLKEIFSQVDYRKVCLSGVAGFEKLRASLERGGVCRTFVFFTERFLGRSG